MFSLEQICVIVKHASCCYACKAAELADLHCIGDPAWKKRFLDVRVMKAYIRVLERYTFNQECLNDTQLNDIIEDLGRLCGVCYTPQNVKYDADWLLQENGAPIHFEDPASSDDDKPLSYLFK